MFKQSLGCVICHKPFDKTFYDVGDQGRSESGGTRYLCSRECYSKWFDVWMAREILTIDQKRQQRKRCLEHYYKNKDYCRAYQNKRNLKTGLAGAI